MSYQFGEKILVRDEDENTWVERIFIAMSDQKEAICAHALAECDDILTRGRLLCYFWREHKPLPKKKVIPYTIETFPLDNSGMLRLKVWGKGEYSTILQKRSDGILYAHGEVTRFYKFDVLADSFEWLQKDGTTTPFGIEADDEVIKILEGE